MTDAKIALMIDAENISHAYVDNIFDITNQLGEVVICAAYGKWHQPNMNKWKTVADERGFILRSVSNTPNSADIHLMMDAVEVVHFKDVDTVCIVTNDNHFVPLCDKLHSLNMTVVGMGYIGAGSNLRRACDNYIFLNLPDLEDVIDDLMSSELHGAAQWITLSELGNLFKQVSNEFSVKHYGFSTLTKLVKAYPDKFELQFNSDETVRAVRFKTHIKQYEALRQDVIKAFSIAPHSRDRWITLSNLGQALSDVKSDFSTKHYGFSTLTKLVESMPDLIETREKGNFITGIRLKDFHDKRLDELNYLLQRAILELVTATDEWVFMSLLGKFLREEHPDFAYEDYGFSGMMQMLENFEDSMEINTTGKAPQVRLRA